MKFNRMSFTYILDTSNTQKDAVNMNCLFQQRGCAFCSDSDGSYSAMLNLEGSFLIYPCFSSLFMKLFYEYDIFRFISFKTIKRFHY